MEIDLQSELSFRSSFRYPLQTNLARKELVWGAVLVLVPVVGWLLNMGHRIEMVHNMHHGREAWPAWRNYPRLFKSGLVTFLGMLYYYAPGFLIAYLGRALRLPLLYVVAGVLMVGATIAIPGYMTHYCHDYDARDIQSHPCATASVRRRLGLLESMGDCIDGFVRLLFRTAVLGHWLLADQCLVLAGRWVQLRIRLQPQIWPRRRDF